MTMRDSYIRQLNSIVVVNDRDVLVFDTNTRPSSARLILAELLVGFAVAESGESR